MYVWLSFGQVLKCFFLTLPCPNVFNFIFYIFYSNFLFTMFRHSGLRIWNSNLQLKLKFGRLFIQSKKLFEKIFENVLRGNAVIDKKWLFIFDKIGLVNFFHINCSHYLEPPIFFIFKFFFLPHTLVVWTLN